MLWRPLLWEGQIGTNYSLNFCGSAWLNAERMKIGKLDISKLISVRKTVTQITQESLVSSMDE